MDFVTFYGINIIFPPVEIVLLLKETSVASETLSELWLLHT